MYLSRVEIDLHNRQKIRNLSNLSAFHNWVEQSFPSEIEQGIRTRKLWRIDQLGGRRYLLVVSSLPPDLIRLEKFGVEGSAQTRTYDAFLGTLKNGCRARFRVVLNPVIAVKESNSSRGRVKPH
ncbi:MAG: type I-E CRISPR-associated protein Cas6/Cse3/CasE, partial [Gallicola sp.]|nr:type I-E CRISPR-associated protein Cas6/Cse3/CasE [Gallicola sp.]